jgi:hypothetical protein
VHYRESAIYVPLQVDAAELSPKPLITPQALLRVCLDANYDFQLIDRWYGRRARD